MKILNTFGEHFASEAKKILETLGEVDYRELTRQELLDIADQYDIIVAGLFPVIDKAVIDKAKKLKYIAIPANTLENADVPYAESKGIEVVSLWGETDFLNTITGTAELAFGLMIDIVRYTPWAFDDVKNNKWEREKFRGHNLFGQTLGIAGMGRLGQWMAKYGLAFGMKVIFYSEHAQADVVPGCEKVSFDELLKESDIISIHAHLNERTEKMFNAAAFEKMKPTGYIVNTARGKIIDEKALLEALKAGKIAGYAADVLADEFEFDNTHQVDDPLIDYAQNHQNVIIVPHIGGMTVESRERTDIFTMEKLRDKLNSSVIASEAKQSRE